MDFLINNIANILAVQPKGMWEFFIFGLDNVIKDYGLTIILLTFIIKVLMLPFEFFNRYCSKRNGVKMAVIQPEIDAVQRRYGSNREEMNKRIMEVYKKNNYSVTGSCLVMFLNLIITTVIFFTMFAGLKNIETYKITTEFETLRSVYEQNIGGTLVETRIDETQSKIQVKLPDNTVVDLDDAKTKIANEEVVKKFGEIKSGFLWIESLWRPDTNASVTLSYNDYLSVSKVKSEDLPQSIYEQILNPIKEDDKYGGWNGYFILIVLSMVLTYLSIKIGYWIGKAKASLKGEPYVDVMSQNKLLIYLMPAIMAVFAWTYNAAFALYMVAGALFSLITNPIFTILVDKLYEINKQKEQEKTAGAVSYSRANVNKPEKTQTKDVEIKNAKIVKNNKKQQSNEIIFKKDSKKTSKKDK